MCPVAACGCRTAPGNRMQLLFRVSGKGVLELRFLPTSLYLLEGFLELCWDNNNIDVKRKFSCGKRMRQPQKSNIAGSSNAGAFVARVCRTHGKNSVHSSNLEKGVANACRNRTHGLAALPVLGVSSFFLYIEYCISDPQLEESRSCGGVTLWQF